jgi:hypothetical protein
MSTKVERPVTVVSLLYERFRILIFKHFSRPVILVKLFRERSRVTKLVHSWRAPIAAILRLLISNRIIVLKSNFYAAVLT